MSSGHSIAKRRTNEDEVRGYPVNRLCALAGVTRQAFYKRDEEALLARLAVEQTKATATVPEQTIAFVFNSLGRRAPMN